MKEFKPFLLLVCFASYKTVNSLPNQSAVILNVDNEVSTKR